MKKIYKTYFDYNFFEFLKKLVNYLLDSILWQEEEDFVEEEEVIKKDLEVHQLSMVEEEGEDLVEENQLEKVWENYLVLWFLVLHLVFVQEQ